MFLKDPPTPTQAKALRAAATWGEQQGLGVEWLSEDGRHLAALCPRCGRIGAVLYDSGDGFASIVWAGESRCPFNGGREPYDFDMCIPPGLAASEEFGCGYCHLLAPEEVARQLQGGTDAERRSAYKAGREWLAWRAWVGYDVSTQRDALRTLAPKEVQS